MPSLGAFVPWLALHLVTLGSWSAWAKSLPVSIQELLPQQADGLIPASSSREDYTSAETAHSSLH